MSFSVLAHGPTTIDGPGFTREALSALANVKSSGGLAHDDRVAAFELYNSLAAEGPKPGAYWKLNLDALDFSKVYAYRHPDAIADLSGVPQEWTTLDTEERAALYLQLDSEAIFIQTGEEATAAGVVLTTLAQAQIKHPELLARVFNSLVPPQSSKFAALNAAFHTGGVFISIPPGVRLERPIVVSYVADRAALFPRTAVLAGEGAQATIVENILAVEGDDPSPVFGVTEVVTDAGAELTYAWLQDLPHNAVRVSTRRARPGANAKVTWIGAEFGSHLDQVVLESELSAPGAGADTYGLFFASGGQHIDLTANVNHGVGATNSFTHVKGAARTAGQARFRGNIRIAEASHGAEASLREDALLLSSDAHIDSVPGLEIAANDVRAYHGAAVGALDEDELFYVMTRGIPRADAERLITLGFFGPIIDRFPVEALRERVRATLEGLIT